MNVASLSLFSRISIGLFIASTSAIAGDIPSFCEGGNFGNCLRVFLSARCAIYSKLDVALTPFALEREARCHTGMQLMLSAMKPSQPAGETNVITFSHRIAPLLRDRKVVEFLRDLPQAVRTALDTRTPFRLWSYTLARAGGDSTRALEWLAVFFQDTVADPIVLDYARIGNRPLNRAERQLWSNALASVAYERLNHPASLESSLVRPYPAIDTEFLNAGFYHFYFAAHLARTLSKQLPGLHGMAGFAPFLLNLIYESNDLDEKRYQNLPANRRPFPLWDSQPFPEKPNTYALTDMYAGYLGALFGLGGEAAVARAEPFKKFAREISQSPLEKTFQLYKNFSPALNSKPTP